MITVEEALRFIKSTARDFGSKVLPLSKSIGHVLKEDWFTDRALPPYNRVTMDGIAINYSHFKKGQYTYNIEGIAAAGSPQITLNTMDHCLEVMTGSILPEGCDTVIRYEDVAISDNKAKILVDTINCQQNVHFKGSDHPPGSKIVCKNTMITSAEIGVGASIGKTNVVVVKKPKVIVISTGDELVPINAQPKPYQIRRSNVHQLIAALQQANISADSDHLRDDKEVIKTILKDYLESYDAIILSGGVSKGKFDFLPEVLKELGVEKLFHKVKQRPGKPFWFGKYKDRCTVFALPGNPNSSFLCLHRYFKFWLSYCTIENPPSYPLAMLTTDITFNKELVLYQEVKLSCDASGRLCATPVRGNGSGDLSNLVNADAFIQLPADRSSFLKGEVYPIIRYR